MRVLSVIVFVCLVAGTSSAGDAENDRLPSSAFRRGLKQLGLTDFLDFYVREYPPNDPIEAALLQRELKLNLYGDPAVPIAERLAAVNEASEILRQLIARHPGEDRRFAWQLDLGRDLIERQAEPYYNNILFRGGTAEDRRRLRKIAEEALGVYDRLLSHVSNETKKLDALSIAEFERRAKTGYIEQIERLLPKAKYFSMWAKYNYCLTLAENDDGRQALLTQIIEYIDQESKLTSVPHKISNYQAQSLLLVGMAYRLLEYPEKAEDYLSRASTVASSVSNFTERHNLTWVVTLSEIERVKNLRDTQRYGQALATLSRYRANVIASETPNFGLRFALALLEGTVYRAQAQAMTGKNPTEQSQLLLRSRQPLIDLARDYPRYQNEIYRTLLDLMGDVQDVSQLDSFEKNIYISGLLRECNDLDQAIANTSTRSKDAAALSDRKELLLDKAIDIAEQLLKDDSDLGKALKPETHFNLGVCYYERGHTLQAITQFNALVSGHPSFDKSSAAARYAVTLSEIAYRDAPELAREHIVSSLRNLMDYFPKSKEAWSRRFLYATVLRDAGQYVESARQFGLVDSDHPQYHRALFELSVCHLLELKKSIDSAAGGDDARMQARRCIDGADRFRMIVGEPSQDNAHLVAESMLVSAEAHLLSGSTNSDIALRLLEEFDERFSNVVHLIGRAMRVRIMVYQAAGNLEEAAKIIPSYVQRDPKNAGVTLQGLLETFKADIDRAEQREQQALVRKKAADALLVARALHSWASGAGSGLEDHERTAFALELGEVLLLAGEHREAFQLFSDVVTREAAEDPQGRCRNGRAILGLAQGHYEAGEHDQALALFNRLYFEASENSHLWWQALLGELRCRKMMKQDPAVLHKIIAQKRAFFPDLGGPQLKKKFLSLQASLKG